LIWKEFMKKRGKEGSRFWKRMTVMNDLARMASGGDGIK